MVKLVSGNAEVVFSHTRTNAGRVNVVVGEDIDLENTNQIVWALSTRMRPDKDVQFGEDGKILFDTMRMTEKLEAPSLPQEIIEKIANRLCGLIDE